MKIANAVTDRALSLRLLFLYLHHPPDVSRLAGVASTECYTFCGSRSPGSLVDRPVSHSRLSSTPTSYIIQTPPLFIAALASLDGVIPLFVLRQSYLPISHLNAAITRLHTHPPMASVPTNSPLSCPAAPPPPVVVLLAMSNLPLNTPSRALLIRTDLPPRPFKRDRTPALQRSLRFSPVARATSTPLSSVGASFVDGLETPRATPAPAENAGSATLIPRPRGAQLSLASCNCIPEKDLEPLKVGLSFCDCSFS